MSVPLNSQNRNPTQSTSSTSSTSFISNTQYISDAYTDLTTTLDDYQLRYKTVTIDNNIFTLLNIVDIDYYNPYARRGLCFILNDNNIVHTVSGTPEFNFKDEQPVFDPVEIDNNTKKKVYVEHIDGNPLQISAFNFKGERYLVLGSESRHLLVRQRYITIDLKMYDDTCYDYIVEQIKMFCNKCLFNTNTKTNLLMNYLSKTGSTVLTEVVFTENQHLVKYNKSNIYFYAVTKYQDPDIKWLQQTAGASLRLFKHFNLETPKYECAEYKNSWSDMETEEKEIVNDTVIKPNTKGLVVYVTVGKDTIVIYKEESTRHLMFRLLRHDLRHDADRQEVTDTITSVNRFMHPEEIKKWTDFYAYCYHPDNRDNALDAWVDSWYAFATVSDEDKIKYNEYWDKSVDDAHLRSI